MVINDGEKLENVARDLGLDEKTINMITDLNLLVNPGIPILKGKSIESNK
jgi:hypothetical protein